MDTLNLVPDNEISDITFPAFENDLFLQGEGNAWFDFDQGTTADLQAAPFDFDANNNTTTLDTEATNLLGGMYIFCYVCCIRYESCCTLLDMVATSSEVV